MADDRTGPPSSNHDRLMAAEGIRSLKEAIEKIALMAAPSQGGTN